jgi:DNA polymerase III epsilon subunit-like protein
MAKTPPLSDAEAALIAARAAAIEAGKSYGRQRLKDELRMRPKADAQPTEFVSNPYGKARIPLYAVADCVPMRRLPAAPRPPSEAQERAKRLFSLRAKLGSAMGTQAVIAARWISEDPLIIDVETTGLSEVDQVVEIAIVDAAGAVLLQSLVRPTVPMSEGARAVHGIADDRLATAPAWPEVAGRVAAILRGRFVIAWHAGFDTNMIRQTAEAHGLPPPLDIDAVECVMALVAPVDHRECMFLMDAMFGLDVPWRSEARSTVASAQAAADLVQSLARRARRWQREIDEITAPA